VVDLSKLLFSRCVCVCVCVCVCFDVIAREFHSEQLITCVPRAGSEVVRIDPLRFLADVVKGD